MGCVLRGARATRSSRRPIPDSRSRSRRCGRIPTRSPRPPCRRRSTTSRRRSELDTPPIIMGHSFGGTLTQLLLDRGFGAAGVVIDSAPTEGVRVSPLSQIKSLFPALKNPANRHKAFGFTHEEFHYAFTNTLSEEESEGLRPLPHPRSRQLGLGLWPDRQLQARPPGDLGRLQEPEPRPAALHRWWRGPHHAAVGEQVERQALQGRSRSPSTTSSKAATTGPAARRDGRPWPTTRSSGPPRTPEARCADGGRTGLSRRTSHSESGGGWDLNPRDACTPNGFQDRPVRPLLHPAVGRV